MKSKITFILSVIWIIILVCPSTVLMYKLTVYLIETDFKEWWIMIIWSLVVPATTSIAILKMKDKDKSKGE